MRYCKRCVQPDTRPGLYFNEDGICGACVYEDEKKGIDWDTREKELRDIARWAKESTKASYDCAIGVSGGKDSTFQALYARDRLGLRVLLVNSEPEGITEVGKHNIENLINLGFDAIKVRPNPKIMKKLIKRDFYKHVNPVKVTEYSLWSSTYTVAQKFDIPLIIQGENAGLTLGVRNSGVGTNGNSLNANKLDTLSEDWCAYIGDEIDEKDMFLYHYDRETLEKKKIKGIWLQYYTKEWSFSHNTDFGKKHGVEGRPGHDPNLAGRISPFCSIDSDLQIVNQLLKYIKLGFGFVTDEAGYWIREGKISRQEGIELVRKYDGKCGERYIKEFCEYIDITLDEFWRVANSARGPMWKQGKDGDWCLKEPIREQ